MRLRRDRRLAGSSGRLESGSGVPFGKLCRRRAGNSSWGAWARAWRVCRVGGVTKAACGNVGVRRADSPASAPRDRRPRTLEAASPADARRGRACSDFATAFDRCAFTTRPSRAPASRPRASRARSARARAPRMRRVADFPRSGGDACTDVGTPASAARRDRRRESPRRPAALGPRHPRRRSLARARPSGRAPDFGRAAIRAERAASRRRARR